MISKNSAPDFLRNGYIVLPNFFNKREISEFEATISAVQNLWLSARAENIGMGWVSIVKPEALMEIFKLPKLIVPIAYLCLGYVKEFAERPDLEVSGWEKRLSLESVIFKEQWQGN